MTNISIQHTQNLCALFLSCCLLDQHQKTLAGLVIAILVSLTAACTKKQVGQFGILLASTLCYNLFGQPHSAIRAALYKATKASCPSMWKSALGSLCQYFKGRSWPVLKLYKYLRTMQVASKMHSAIHTK